MLYYLSSFIFCFCIIYCIFRLCLIINIIIIKTFRENIGILENLEDSKRAWRLALF